MVDQTINRTSQVLQRSLDGEYVVYHPETDDAMALDRVGSLIWDALEAAPTRAELIDTFADRFDQPPARIAADVEALLEALLEARLIWIDDDDQRPDAD